jgi:hypothetical protein
MGDEDLPSIFGSISALKAVVPKSEGPRKGELCADATLEEHLGDGLKGSCWRGELNGKSVAVHLLRRRVTEAARVSFRESIDSLMSALEGKSAPGILKPRTVAEDRSAFTTRLCILGTMVDVPRTLDWDLGRKLVAIATIAESLETLHTRKLYHGALSPAAILLDDDSMPWLAGVGGTNLLVGTPGDSADPHSLHTYAAPEVKFGGTVDSRSDIYSLGRVLHYLLLGRHVLPREEDLPGLSELTSNPAGLVRIIRKCTRAEPNDRYEAIEVFLKDLVKYQKHDEVGTRLSGAEELVVETSTVEPLLRQFDRQRTQPVARVILESEPEDGLADSEAATARAPTSEEARLQEARKAKRGKAKKAADAADSSVNERRGKAGTNQMVVGAGAVIIIAAIALAFFGGEGGMVIGPILALIGAGMAVMGLAGGMK